MSETKTEAKALTHKFKEEFHKIEMSTGNGRMFNATTITQGDIDRMDERQRNKYLEPNEAFGENIPKKELKPAK